MNSHHLWMLCKKDWLILALRFLLFTSCIFTISLVFPLGKMCFPSFEQICILFNQGCFVPSLVEISQSVLEKKIFIPTATAVQGVHVYRNHSVCQFVWLFVCLPVRLFVRLWIRNRHTTGLALTFADHKCCTLKHSWSRYDFQLSP